MKYICFKSEEYGEEVIIFPTTINHDCMAESMSRVKNQTVGDWVRIHRQPVSAGFVNTFGECFGRSESLNLDSRESVDTFLLNKQYFAFYK